MDIAALIKARINDGRRVSDGDALAAAEEIERLRSEVAFLKEDRRQAEAMREAAMRRAYPDLFPGSGRWPVETDSHE